MKLLFKILLPVLLVVSTGLFVSTIYTYDKSIEVLRDSNVSLQKMATANALVELEHDIEFNILNAISLAQTGILQPYLAGTVLQRAQNAPDVRDRIVNMTNTYYYVMIGVLNTKGIVLDHTVNDFIGKDFSNEAFFKEAMAGKVAIGNPYRYKEHVVYNVASPVHDVVTEEIIGVVFNVSRLTDTMSERMELGDKGYLFVADKSGTVFIHKDETKVLSKTLAAYDWGKEILNNLDGNTLSFIDEGSAKIARYEYLKNPGWIAVAVRDIGELENPSIEIRNRAVIIAIVILIVLAAIIYLYIKNILDGLLKAVQYAEQVAQGVLDKDLDFGSSSEGVFKSYVLRPFLKLIGHAKDSKEVNKIKTLEQLNRSDELGVLYKSLYDMVASMRLMVKAADDSSRMKSEFLANMSHEIRTPLNAVIGLAHLFLESKEDNAKKRDYIEKIEIAGKSLLGIINNILDTSKIEAGMFDLEEIHFNLHEIRDQIYTIYQDSAKAKNLDFSFEIDASLNTFYIGDPVRLMQVLNNFVGNAIKFTEKGSISIRCFEGSEVAKNLECPEGSVPVCIKVTDTGIGFTKEQEELLFKPFSQADNSITRRFGGTGLGLTISKHIVQMMNGVLLVDSEANKGTSFTIVVFLTPAKESAITKSEEDGSFSVDLTGKRILIVEDNMINQLIMEELLAKTNAEIAIADNGQIAVDMVEKQEFDLILMDMQMPVMDGLKATEIIRQNHTIEKLPIIAVTANAMKEDKERGISIGLNDYLTKPIDPHNLMLVLYHWLHGPD